jgi:outer membrane protein
MTGQQALVLMAALAFACRALRTLAAQAVGFCQLYDEAFSNDAQLQSARASLAATSEELSRARVKLLLQVSASSGCCG